MKFLVVVLALAALVQAEPEADPGYLYGRYYGYPGYYGYPYGYAARSFYGYGLPGYSYTHVDRLHKREADPQVLAAAPLTTSALPLVYNNAAPLFPTAPAAFAPINPLVYNTAPVATAPIAPVAPVVYNTAPAAVAVAAPAVVPARPYTPYDCVTADGCAVRALKEAGLAKREAAPEAEAEAEAEALFYNYYNRGYYPYGFYNGYYNYPYSNYYGYPYSYPYAAPYAAAPVAAAPAPVTTVVKTVVEQPAVVAAPAPVVKAAPVVAAPVVAPVVRTSPPVVTPVVEEVAKPVTYTHLGAHPIHPTTVLEKTSRVVGHTVY